MRYLDPLIALALLAVYGYLHIKDASLYLANRAPMWAAASIAAVPALILVGWIAREQWPQWYRRVAQWWAARRAEPVTLPEPVLLDDSFVEEDEDTQLSYPPREAA